ncbi:MAG: TonB-dependent receptor [Bryobacteraceae bacterium]
MKVKYLLLLLLSAESVFAQADRGFITGLVTDPQGAPVPDVNVEIKASSTGVVTNVKTTTSGNFSTPPLVIGTYEITVSVSGFKAFHASGITLASGQTFRQDIQLQVGAIQQSVEVSGQVEQLNADNPQMSASVNQLAYESLPAIMGSGENRVPEAQLYTFPTFVAPTQGNIYPGSAFGARINGGQRSAFENFLDGASYGEVSGHNGTQERSAPYESIAETRIVDNTFSAQYGHTSGGFVEYTTKSGTNDYHGGVYEYFDNDKLQARGEIAPVRPPVRQNQYGFTLAGPISIPKLYNGKNKSFFFFNFDQFKFTTAGAGSGFATVADNQNRSGDFSQYLTGQQVGTDACGRPVYNGEIFDPSSTTSAASCGGPATATVRTPFPGNIIPASQFSKVATNIQSYLPAPTNSALSNNYLLGPAQSFLNARTILTRIDHNITENIRLALTYNYDDRPRELDCNNIGGCGEPIGHPRLQEIQTHTAHLQLTYIISPSFFTHFVASYDRWVLPDTYPSIVDKGWASKVGITGIPYADAGGFPNINFDERYLGFGVDGTGDLQGTDRWQFLDDTTKILGKHTLKVGFEYRWERWFTGNYIGDAGVFNFRAANTGTYDANGNLISGTGDPYASFLLGQVSSANFSIPAFSDYRRPYFGPWVNDDWKVTDKLTLSFGFRFDLQFPRTERHNEFSSFEPNLPNPGAGNILGALAFAGLNGRSNTFENLQADTYGPRFGFAYRATDKTVVRGGYGIYYAGVTMNGFNANPNYGYSTNPSVTDLSNGRQAIFQLDNGFPASAVALPPQITPTLENGTTVQYMNPNGVTLPRYQNWTLSVQRQLSNSMMLDVAYVANHGTRLISGSQMSDLNQNNPLILQQYPQSVLTATVGTAAADGFPAPYPGFTGTVAQALRPYPQYQSIPEFNGANGWSTYNSLQTTFRKNLSNGLQLNVGWVYSKLMTNGAESGLSEGFGGAQPISVYLPTKAVSIDNVPNVLTITFVDELPFGKGRALLNRGGFVNAVLGDWTLAGNLRYESGRPLGIYYSNNPYSDVLFNSGYLPNRVAGVSGYGDTNNGNIIVGVSQYILPSAFTTPPAGSLGNEGRLDSVLRGWANYNEDLSLYKDFIIKERVTWRVGGNGKNVFNRHQWCDADTNLNDAGFGTITGQCNLPRVFELYMKVSF